MGLKREGGGRGRNFSLALLFTIFCGGGVEEGIL